jgi:hypothetical protein
VILLVLCDATWYCSVLPVLLILLLYYHVLVQLDFYNSCTAFLLMTVPSNYKILLPQQHENISNRVAQFNILDLLVNSIDTAPILIACNRSWLLSWLIVFIWRLFVVTIMLFISVMIPIYISDDYVPCT